MNGTPGNPVGWLEGDPHLAGGSKYTPPPAFSYSSDQRGRLPPPNVHQGWKLLRDRDCKKAHFKRRPRKEPRDTLLWRGQPVTHWSGTS